MSNFFGCEILKGTQAVICPVDRHILFDFQVPGCLARPAKIHKALVDLRKR
jgi:Ni,Fe-hydrogenase III small subunit